jgi:O-antigen ligase
MIPFPLIRPLDAPAARWLHSAAVLFLAFLPVAMVVANRSSIAFLVLSTLCALGGLIAEGGWRDLVARVRAALATPLGLATLAFLGWSGLSVMWSGARPVSLHYLGEFWLPVCTALVLAFILPSRLSRAGLWTIAAFLVLACAMVLFELATGITYRRTLGLRADGHIFNRSTVTILTLAIPVWVGLLRGQGLLPRMGALVLVGCVAAVSLLTESGAAALGLAVAVLATAAALVAPRLALWAGGIALLALLAVAPVLGSSAQALVPPEVHRALSGAHSRERVDIWTSYGAVVSQEPWLGTGFATSARMPTLPVASRVPRKLRPGLAQSHPHNAALQIWTELGGIGAVLAGLVIALVLRALSRLPDAQLLTALPLFGVAAAISLVSHGAWQGWWTAAVGAAVVLARACFDLGSPATPRPADLMRLRAAAPREAPPVMS